MGNHKKLLQFLRPDLAVAAAPAKSSSTTSDDDDDSYYGDNTTCSTPATPTTSASASTAASPYAASPWTQLPGLSPRSGPDDATRQRTGLLGSIVKEGGDGHAHGKSSPRMAYGST